MNTENTFHFLSEMTLGRDLPDATQDEIKNEPMLFKCDLEHADRLGGRLTREFIHHLPTDWKNGPLLWGDASLTQFATGIAEFPDVPMGSVYYREWHPLVEDAIRRGELLRVTAPQRLIRFNWTTWHQGTPATKNGWRFFIRATRGSNAGAANEQRNQAQVYMPAPMAGW